MLVDKKNAMKTPEQYYVIARDMFFSAHPDFNQALNEITEEEAKQAGMEPEAYRALQAERIYAAFLRQKKLDGMIFRSSLPSRIKKWLQRRLRII
ncbi:Uncharacterised protein [Tatumella ptyseos]|uniref:Uncharacterized protein n=1 Tax=Tatumella ptyseos TaxID=82987 RepID=A0A2X5NPY5_9GAMM|nr:DUF6388 family protein [Tatumella ptyseos]SQK75226.1 Uncharacterised protein [Tatumella ptyseos]